MSSKALTLIITLVLCFPQYVQADCAVAGSGGDAARIAFSGMPLLVPQQGRVGSFYGAEVLLPQLLVAGMNQQGRFAALDYSHLDVRGLMRPRGMFSSHVVDTELSWEYVELPEAEYLVTGVIESVGMARDKATPFFIRYFDRSMALMDRRFNQPRQLSLVVELYDIADGALIMQKRYMHYANWDLSRREAPGASSPKVWLTDYGRKALGALETVIADIEVALGCDGSAQATLDS